MKLMVNGIPREVSPTKAKALESQFEEFKEALEAQGSTPEEWFNKAQRDDLVIGVLKVSHLDHLATDIGLAFLKERLGINQCQNEQPYLNRCPLAVHREH